MASSRTTAHPAGAENLSSSWATIDATMTWPPPVPGGRDRVMLARELDEPLHDDATAVTGVAAGAGETGPTRVATSPVATTAASRDKRRERMIIAVDFLRKALESWP